MNKDTTGLPAEQPITPDTPETYAQGIQAKIDGLCVLIEMAQAERDELARKIRGYRESIKEWKRALPRKPRAKKAT